MKYLKNKKFLVGAIMFLALGLGFSTTFAATRMNSNQEDPNHGHASAEAHKAAHDKEAQEKSGDHHEGATSQIATDASVANSQPDMSVDLFADGAKPGEVTLPVGQVLQFNSKDGKTHKMALGQGGTEHEHTSATNSGEFGADEGWRVRFDNVGTFYFHDHLNPSINVLVVVYKPTSTN